MHTLHFQFSKYDINHFSTVSHNLIFFSRIWSKISWSTISNAADKFVITNAVISFLSIAQRMSLIILRIFVSQMCTDLYANWYDDDAQFSELNSLNGSSTIFSATFHLNGILLTGLKLYITLTAFSWHRVYGLLKMFFCDLTEFWKNR